MTRPKSTRAALQAERDEAIRIAGILSSQGAPRYADECLFCQRDVADPHRDNCAWYKAFQQLQQLKGETL